MFKMMQPELVQISSWHSCQSFETLMIESGQVLKNIDAEMGSFEQSCSCITLENFPDVTSSSIQNFSSALDQMQYCSESYGGGDYDGIFATFPADRYCLLSSEANSFSDYKPMLDDRDGDSNWLVQESCLSESMSIDVPFNQASFNFPGADARDDPEMGIRHLLKAYGEAMEMDQKELAGEVLKGLQDKASPTGSILERLTYHLIQSSEKQPDFLRKEAIRNYEAAFKAFYQIFPYGRFAHFTVNSVILHAIPEHTEVVHIVDFDIGNGVQWPPVIESLGRRGHREVRLTSIRWNNEQDRSCSPPSQKLEKIKTRLDKHVKISCLKLKMEEIDMEDLVFRMKNKKGTHEGREWLAFNCMVGLPHMGEGRSVRNVMDFLKIAKESINSNNNSNGSHSSRGIITLGDGIGWGKGVNCSGYNSIFEGQLLQFQILLESMDANFPHHLREARIAMDCLFLTPYISTICDFEMWEDISRDFQELSEVGLEAWGMEKHDLVEAKELVREGENSYWVCLEGIKGNQMVLGYKGTPLVKVSSWR